MNGKMKLYTSTGTREFVNQLRDYNVGLMLVPPTWRNPRSWPYFAIDNGCYSAYSRGVMWNDRPFIKTLDRVVNENLHPDFVVIPDKVSDRQATLELAQHWIHNVFETRYKESELPLYLAVQDGMSEDDIGRFLPFISGIFVGGSIEWKLSTMSQWCRYAHDNGLGCHVGRIGPIKRMMLAELSGADSVDSTTWVQTRDGVRHYVGGYRHQTVLQGVLDERY